MKRLSLILSVAPSFALSFFPFGRPFVLPLLSSHTESCSRIPRPPQCKGPRYATACSCSMRDIENTYQPGAVSLYRNIHWASVELTIHCRIKRGSS